jgi:hypothetical protein
MNRPHGRSILVSLGWVVISCIIVGNLLWVGCSKDPLEPDPTPAPPFSIDDEIVLDASPLPGVSASSVVGDESTFDMGALLLVQNGEFNEFDIGYQSPTSCDLDIDILNHDLLQWDRFANRPPAGTMCVGIFSNKTHILAEQKLSAGDYVDTNDRLKLKNAPAGTTVRALRINPRYKALPLAVTDAAYPRGIYYDGSAFWLGDFYMFKMSAAGQILEQINTPVYFHFGLTWDGEKFWTAWSDASQWKICAFDKTGALSCSFNVTQTVDDGLVFAQDKLWVGYDGGTDPVILVIDPSSSCLAGTAQIDNTITLAISEINAMASDGTFIYVASDDEVIKFTTGGVAAGTYTLPVDGVQAMSWHSGGLWMVHRGPLYVRTDEYFVSRFQLP